jgi:hypothetical protein
MRIQAHTSNSKLYDQSRPGRCRNAFSLQVKFTGLAPIHAVWCAWTQTVGHAKPAMQINPSSNPSRTPCHANDNRAGNTSSSILTMKTWNRGAERIVDVLGKSDGPRSVDRLSQSQPSRIRGTEERSPRIAGELSGESHNAYLAPTLNHPKAVIARAACSGRLAAIQEILQQLQPI